ncbi:MAG TPA: sugar ABC transporter substrate-binding protein [Sedimenticola thiotaurini]|uniref:Sugar ABC transporter substrate-binding protein n=1 Tax=Sedimenticola thiotaurini TaxID=1543721 RepID=A0A831RNC1_9GAMM|nr:sugar ABC transporter substrate-binding protein [Sedimenticola thiotaurini]
MNIRHAFVGLLIAGLALAGCSTQSPYPQLPESEGNAQYSTKYRIAPGDSVEIFVWRNPDVSKTVTVRPDGYLTAPLLEDIPAAEKTPTELARDIEKELSTYLRDPLVTVIVNGFIGAYEDQIRVVGEAAKPQALLYRDSMTLLDVMIAVGGITDFADGDKATIVRMENGERKQYNVRVESLIRDGDITANVDMKPGDILIIPESWF